MPAPTRTPRPGSSRSWPGRRPRSGATEGGGMSPAFLTPALARLREAGLRPTRPRRILLAVLAEADRALDAQEILGRARRLDPRISLATVYRFLAALRRTGLS